MRKLFCVLLSCCIITLSVVPFRADEVSASAEAFVLYCVDNGEVLLSGNPEEELPIASTTKIMTALLTLEAAGEDNRVVEFTDEMTAEGSSMYLKVGEKVTLYDLAVGMMMQSGNDAANAAALALAGSLEGFSTMMNDKAREVGMEHTHFVTPSGLDEPEHYSCAYDMALLMAYALQNEDFAEITSQTSMTVDFVYPEDKSMTYPNHNKLLRLYDDCIGGKTGYTDMSGRTLVSAARRGGMTLIAVTLNDRDDWNDHIALYDYGFENYAAVTPRADSEYTLDVVGGTVDTVFLTAGDGATAVVPASEVDNIQTTVYLPAFAYAPVAEGEQAGKVIYLLDGEIIGEQPLYFSENIQDNQNRRSLIQYIKDLLNWQS